MISDLFSTESAKAILAIPIHYNPRQDKLIWVPDSKGMFSIKSVHDQSFRFSISNNPQNSHWKKLWKARLPKRLKMLLWRIGVDDLPTKVNPNRKLNHIDPTCILCNSGDETYVHLFFECPFSRAFWALACWDIRYNDSSFVSNEDIVKLIISPPSSPLPAHDQWRISLKMAIIIDEIWRTRNSTQFQVKQTFTSRSKLCF